MKKMPTAREIFKKYSDKANRIQEVRFEEMMIEFAKLHVEAALKAAEYTTEEYDFSVEIKNSYPLENIK